MHLTSVLPAREQIAIAQAALLAHAGKHAEAEVARFAGGYHGITAVQPQATEGRRIH